MEVQQHHIDHPFVQYLLKAWNKSTIDAYIKLSKAGTSSITFIHGRFDPLRNFYVPPRATPDGPQNERETHALWKTFYDIKPGGLGAHDWLSRIFERALEKEQHMSTRKIEIGDITLMFYFNQSHSQRFIANRLAGEGFSWRQRAAGHEDLLGLHGVTEAECTDWWQRWRNTNGNVVDFGRALEHDMEMWGKRAADALKVRSLCTLTEHELIARLNNARDNRINASVSTDDFKPGGFNLFMKLLEKMPGNSMQQHAYAYTLMLGDAAYNTTQTTEQIDFDATPARDETVYYTPPEIVSFNPINEGTNAMSTTTLSFNTINYVSINGGAPIDLSQLPADNIFSLIEQAEAEIKRLNDISAKPKALVARIESLQAGIQRLVAEVDGRDAS